MISYNNAILYASFMHDDGDPVLDTPLWQLAEDADDDGGEEWMSRDSSPSPEGSTFAPDLDADLPSTVDPVVEVGDQSWKGYEGKSASDAASWSASEGPLEVKSASSGSPHGGGEGWGSARVAPGVYGGEPHARPLTTIDDGGARGRESDTSWGQDVMIDRVSPGPPAVEGEPSSEPLARGARVTDWFEETFGEAAGAGTEGGGYCGTPVDDTPWTSAQMYDTSGSSGMGVGDGSTHVEQGGGVGEGWVPRAAPEGERGEGVSCIGEGGSARRYHDSREEEGVDRGQRRDVGGAQRGAGEERPGGPSPSSPPQVSPPRRQPRRRRRYLDLEVFCEDEEEEELRLPPVRLDMRGASRGASGEDVEEQSSSMDIRKRPTKALRAVLERLSWW